MPARDLNLVRFISANYVELQGLRKVVDGVSLLLLWTIMRVGSPTEDAGLFFGASLVWVVATMVAAGRVARHYREQFGQIAGNNDLRETAPAARAYTVYRLLLASAALWIGGWFALLLPILTLRVAWKAWRDWPFRSHLLLLVIVGGAFSVALLAVSTRFEFLEWQWRFIWTGAPALIVVGFFDHYLLAGAMDRAGGLEKSHNANTI
jgi:hypothetical protein